MKKTFLILAGTILLLAGCAKSTPENHTTVGVIVSIPKDGRELEIRHEKFPDGFMEGMTMTFETEDAKLAKGLKPGDKVRFTLGKKGDDYLVVAVKEI